jgi:hypothetical protein
MSTVQTSEHLAQETRRLAGSSPGNVDVRTAVRNLTLHALQSRMLTASHVASVTKAVGLGLGDALKGPAQHVRNAAAQAAEGFGEAASKALHALELAAREFTAHGGRLSPGESQQLLDEIAHMEQVLGEGWKHEHVRTPPDWEARVKRLTDHVKRAVGGTENGGEAVRATLHELEAGSREGLRAAGDAGRVLGLMASGALLGLSEILQETAKPPH